MQGILEQILNSLNRLHNKFDVFEERLAVVEQVVEVHHPNDTLNAPAASPVALHGAQKHTGLILCKLRSNGCEQVAGPSQVDHSLPLERHIDGSKGDARNSRPDIKKIVPDILLAPAAQRTQSEQLSLEKLPLDGWYCFNLPRRAAAPCRPKFPRKLWLRAGLEELAPADVQNEGLLHPRRPPLQEWPAAVVVGRQNGRSPVPIDKLTRRVRTLAYVRRVQQQWKRELIAFDRDKLALEADIETDTEGEAPAFGVLQVDEMDAADDAEELNDCLPIWNPEEEGQFSCSDEEDLPEGEGDDVERDMASDEFDAELEGNAIEASVLEEERAEALDRLLSLLRLGTAHSADADAVLLTRRLQSQLEQESLKACPPAGRAQHIQFQKKVVAILSGLAVALGSQGEAWERRERPKLERLGHKIWKLGRDREEVGAWRERVVEYQERLVRYVLELFKTHVQGWRASRVLLQRSTGVLQASYSDLLEYEERLRIAALPRQPPKPPPVSRALSEGGPATGEHPGLRQGECPLPGRAGGSRSSGDMADFLKQDVGAIIGARGGGDTGRGASREVVGTSSMDCSGSSEHTDSESGERGAGWRQRGVAAGGSDSGASTDQGADNAAATSSSSDEGDDISMKTAHAEFCLPSSQRPAAAPWNLARLKPGETQVLFAPKMAEPGPSAVAQGATEQPVDGAAIGGEGVQEGKCCRAEPGPVQEVQGEDIEEGHSLSSMRGAQEGTSVEGGKGLGGRSASGSQSYSPAPSAPNPPATFLGMEAGDQQDAGATGNSPDGGLARSPAPSAGEQPLSAMGKSGTSAGSGGQGQDTWPCEDDATMHAVRSHADAEVDCHQAAAASDEAGGAELERGSARRDVEAMAVDDVDDDADGSPVATEEEGGGVLAEGSLVEVLRVGGRSYRWERAVVVEGQGATGSVRVRTLDRRGQSHEEDVESALVWPAGGVGAPVPPGKLHAGCIYEVETLRSGSDQRASYELAVVLGKQLLQTVAPRFLLEDEPEEGAGLPKVERFLRRCANERARLREGGDASRHNESQGYTIWFLKLGSSEVCEAEYCPSQGGLTPLVRECQAWNSRENCWNGALGIGHRLAGSKVLGLQLEGWRERGTLLEQMGHAALTRLDERLAQEQEGAWSDQEEGEGAAVAEAALKQRLHRQFKRGYLARNPCQDLSRLQRALGMPRPPHQRIEARESGAERGNFAVVRVRKFERRPQLRRLVKKKDQLEQEGEATRKDAELQRKNKQRLLQLAERERKRRRLSDSQVQLPITIGPDEPAAAAVPLLGEQKDHRGEVLMVPGKMAKALKEHQWEGVRFVWSSLVVDFESDEDLEGGCILAHHMGLGKSLQTITFLHCFHALHPASRSLVIVPKNVKVNWHDECALWLPRPHIDQDGAHVGLTMRRVRMFHDSRDVRRWYKQSHGALIITYEEFRRLALPRAAAKDGGSNALAGAAGGGAGAEGGTGQVGEAVAEALQEQEPVDREIMEMLTEGPHIVVVDEGHVIKNPKGKLRMALGKIKTKRRLALTGYPLQNNLKEMYAMVSWCDPNVLGDLRSFEEDFVEPILAGQLPSAGSRAQKRMCQQLSVLHDLTDRVVHRKGEELLRGELPPKQEHILKLHLSAVQQEVYQAYLQGVAHCGKALFRDRERLNELCDRPSSFRAWLSSILEGDEQQGEQREGDDLQQAQQQQVREDAAANDFDAGTGRALKQSIPQELARTLMDIIEAAEARGEGFTTAGTHKMWALRQLVLFCLQHDEQLIVVAERLATLDAVGEMLRRVRQEEGAAVAVGTLTGQTPAQERQHLVERMKRKKLQVLLMSKAGSHGINLVSCRRMVVLDEPWNPVYNAQAIARIFRYGQRRPSYVYRLCYNGSMQYNIYLRNVNKAALFRRVVDKQTVKHTHQKLDPDQLSVYCFKPDAVDAAQVKEMEQLRHNSQSDPALAALLDADAQHAQRGQHVAYVEDHDKNLAEDPSQGLTLKEKRTAAAQFLLQQASGARTRSQLKRIRKNHPDLDDAAWEGMLQEAQALMAQQQAQQQPPHLARPGPTLPLTGSVPGMQAFAAARPATAAAAGPRVAPAVLGVPPPFPTGAGPCLAAPTSGSSAPPGQPPPKQRGRPPQKPSIASGMTREMHSLAQHLAPSMAQHAQQGGTLQSYVHELVGRYRCGTEERLWGWMGGQAGITPQQVQGLVTSLFSAVHQPKAQQAQRQQLAPPQQQQPAAAAVPGRPALPLPHPPPVPALGVSAPAQHAQQSLPKPPTALSLAVAQPQEGGGRDSLVQEIELRLRALEAQSSKVAPQQGGSTQCELPTATLQQRHRHQQQQRPASHRPHQQHHHHQVRISGPDTLQATAEASPAAPTRPQQQHNADLGVKGAPAAAPSLSPVSGGPRHDPRPQQEAQQAQQPPTQLPPHPHPLVVCQQATPRKSLPTSPAKQQQQRQGQQQPEASASTHSHSSRDGDGGESSGGSSQPADQGGSAGGRRLRSMSQAGQGRRSAARGEGGRQRGSAHSSGGSRGGEGGGGLVEGVSDWRGRGGQKRSQPHSAREEGGREGPASGSVIDLTDL